MTRKALGLMLALLLALLPMAPAARAERLTDAELMGYYEDAIFVGDSITDMLRLYTIRQREGNPDFLRGARFYCATNYRLDNASALRPLNPPNVNLVCEGREMSMMQIVARRQPGKLFILLGVNELIGLDPERGMALTERIAQRVAERSPGTRLYFFSLTPVTPAYSGRRELQAHWDSYNELLRAKCEALGIGYVEIAPGLKDADGYLRADLTWDGEYHLNNQGNAIWVQEMLDYAQAEYDAGRWKPLPDGVWILFPDR